MTSNLLNFIVVNYSSFGTSVIGLPLTTVVPYLLQQQVEKDLYIDPFTCESLDDAAK